MLSRLGLFECVGAISGVLFCHHWAHRRTLLLDAGKLPQDASRIGNPAAYISGMAKSLITAHAFLDFVDGSPSVYHAVENVRMRLEREGYERLNEQCSWTSNISPGGKYYVIRSGTSSSSLIAFAVGRLWKPGNSFAMVATHVDSPCLKVKPISSRSYSPYLQTGVQTYGGGLWHTWFDRDLSLAGQVMVRTAPDRIESRLVDLVRPILRIPTIAVHYDKQNPFKINTELDLLPIIGLHSSAAVPLVKQSAPLHDPSIVSVLPKDAQQSISSSRTRHGIISNLVAQQLSANPDDIIDFDLSLYDTQPAQFGGKSGEFIYASRIDNLMMTFCALEGLTRSMSKAHSLDDESSVRLVSMFDNEEISSGTVAGGRSNFLTSVIRRICTSDKATSDPTAYEQSLARSFLISADMQHAVHPTYHGWHETRHAVNPNGGIVISNDDARHLTKNTPGLVLLTEIARRASKQSYPSQPPEAQDNLNTEKNSEAFYFQFFARANNVQCGQTLGPILSTKLGVRTVDLGNAQLSMHSVREIAGTYDVEHASRFLQVFFERFSEVDEMVKVD